MTITDPVFEKYHWVFAQAKEVVSEGRLKCNTHDILVYAWVLDDVAHCVARERTDATARLQAVYVKADYAEIWRVCEKAPSRPTEILLVLADEEGLYAFRYEYENDKNLRVLN